MPRNMLKNIILYHFPHESGAASCTDLALDWALFPGFYLKTCQRKVLLTLERYPHLEAKNIEILTGEEAYKFLLETHCGLKSRLAGENEIVAQFKTAYLEYIASPYRETRLMEVLEKLFKDGKDIRARHLKNLGNYSYAGLTKKILSSHIKTCKNVKKEVVILGSGQLCQDLLKVLSKKFTPVICARNKERVLELSRSHALKTIDWNLFAKRPEILHPYPAILNTIGLDRVLFETHFFKTWPAYPSPDKVFIDLAGPSIVCSQVDYQKLFRLNDLYQVKGEYKAEKEKKLAKALEVIQERTLYRQKIWDKTPSYA